MTKTAQQLDDEYEALIAEGEVVEQEERTATQKKNLWQAKCYVWWTEAKEITGFCGCRPLCKKFFYLRGVIECGLL